MANKFGLNDWLLQYLLNETAEIACSNKQASQLVKVIKVLLMSS